MHTITILIFAILVWVSLYAIYFNFIRSIIITRARFHVNAINDELDLLALEGKILPNDKAVRILKLRVKKAYSFIPTFDLTTILLAYSHDMIMPKSIIEDEEATISASQDAIGKLSNRLDMAMFAGFAANSPFLLGVVIILIIGAAALSALARSLETKLAIVFWNAIYTRSNAGSNIPFRKDISATCA